MTDFPTSPRPLDHLVFPTADLDIARARLTELGFTVAPNGVHPFGTENCCVYFADGAFLEPLAVGDSEKAEMAIRDGNVFVARDALYRSLNGDEGFSALVFGTGNARADHDGFAEAGISAGEILAFSRPFVGANGKTDTASFLLAFAAERNSPDSLFFTCQRVNAPAVDRSALQRHENGVTRIARVVLSAQRPPDYRTFIAGLSGGEVSDRASGIEVEAANGAIAVLDPRGLQEEFAIASAEEPGLRLQCVVFGASDLGTIENLLATRGIACDRRGNRLIVPPAPGQGAHFAFEAIS